MQQKSGRKKIDPMLSFHLMKFAFQDFQTTLCHLTKQEYTKVYQHANEEMLLHKVILSCKESCCVVIPESLLNQTLQGVINEYPSREHFHATLQENTISLADYTLALHYDLRVETILARVACNIPPVTTADMFHYFNNNKTEFYQPEQRCASHILIRYDPLSPVETASAHQKITMIHRRVCKKPETFKEEAKFFVGCNTVTADDFTGKFTAGELCHKLDKSLFSLAPGEISPIIENSSGFNIIQCTKIYPEKYITFREASPAISAILLKKKQLRACRIWLQKLIQPNK
ncbi:MAG: peptidylprolyl isomerase [Desulfocapsa sp.]|nr:peptidylprolyl isomerase [Desulfocapsa sp.]